jgi:hypothetical protein
VVVANQSGLPFNAELQTVSVQPTIQEVILKDAIRTPTTLPILDDVPFVIPRAGGWSLTLPIAIGDECIVVFQDMGIDNWWQSGGVQPQPDGWLYRHDIGDAVAIFGVTSNPRALAGYSTTSAQLRSDDQTVIVDLSETGVTITAPTVNIMAAGGTPQPLVNGAWLAWYKAHIQPYLVSSGYSGPPMPLDSETTVLGGQ